MLFLFVFVKLCGPKVGEFTPRGARRALGEPAPPHIGQIHFLSIPFDAPLSGWALCYAPQYTSFPGRGGCKKVAGREHIAVYILVSLGSPIWLKCELRLIGFKVTVSYVRALV